MPVFRKFASIELTSSGPWSVLNNTIRPQSDITEQRGEHHLRLAQAWQNPAAPGGLIAVEFVLILFHLAVG